MTIQQLQTLIDAYNKMRELQDIVQSGNSSHWGRMLAEQRKCDKIFGELHEKIVMQHLKEQKSMFIMPDDNF